MTRYACFFIIQVIKLKKNYFTKLKIRAISTSRFFLLTHCNHTLFYRVKVGNKHFKFVDHVLIATKEVKSQKRLTLLKHNKYLR